IPLEPAMPFHTAPYLHFPRPIARACARLGTSTHNMAIERYRIGNRRKDRLARKCNHCGVLEDERHVLEDCPLFDAARNKLPNHIHILMQALEPDLAMGEFLQEVLGIVDKRY